MNAKYQNGQQVTVWFPFSDGHKEVQTIGKVLSARECGTAKYPLYTLYDCTTPDGFYVAWENELTLTTPEDHAQLKREQEAEAQS